jgi:hypothetical protein
MSLAATVHPQTSAVRLSWLAPGLALAAAIAWMQPYDLVFGWITLGSPPLRAALIVLMALVGTSLGERAGLALEDRRGAFPVRDALMAALAVAVFCALCDWIWRPELHPGYVQFLSATPLAQRSLRFAMRAFNESIIYRLFLGSLLVWAFGRVWKKADGQTADGAFWAGFALSQIVNIWINVSALAPLTPAAAAHDALRYVAPGVVWGWLYWRRGFVANEIACTSVHLFFQPLVVLGL